MKIAVFSDVHDNLERFREVAEIIKREKIKVGICCGDIGELATLEEVSKSFETLYLALGNMDFKLMDKAGLFPENVIAAQNFGEVTLQRVRPSAEKGDILCARAAFVHDNYAAKELANSGKYDIVFYGHTHTPWEEKIGNTVLLNPGEVAGHFGRATFALFDLKNMEAELKILK